MYLLQQMYPVSKELELLAETSWTPIKLYEYGTTRDGVSLRATTPHNPSVFWIINWLFSKPTA